MRNIIDSKGWRKTQRTNGMDSSIEDYTIRITEHSFPRGLTTLKQRCRFMFVLQIISL